MAETEQISQKLNKYLLEVIQLLQNKKLQKQNANTKLQKLNEDEIPDLQILNKYEKKYKNCV
jgi:hypothetical protein